MTSDDSNLNVMVIHGIKYNIWYHSMCPKHAFGLNKFCFISTALVYCYNYSVQTICCQTGAVITSMGLFLFIEYCLPLCIMYVPKWKRVLFKIRTGSLCNVSSLLLSYYTIKHVGVLLFTNRHFPNQFLQFYGFSYSWGSFINEKVESE